MPGLRAVVEIMVAQRVLYHQGDFAIAGSSAPLCAKALSHPQIKIACQRLQGSRIQRANRVYMVKPRSQLHSTRKIMREQQAAAVQRYGLGVFVGITYQRRIDRGRNTRRCCTGNLVRVIHGQIAAWSKLIFERAFQPAIKGVEIALEAFRGYGRIGVGDEIYPDDVADLVVIDPDIKA